MKGIFYMKKIVYLIAAAMLLTGCSDAPSAPAEESSEQFSLPETEADEHTDSPENEQHEQVTLKMGIFYEENDFSSFISQQNGSESYVKIEPIYYTQYDVYDKAADKQKSTGLDQLNLDLVSGNAPDMAVFMNTPQYIANKSVFADLYTLMDDDLSRDDFMPNVLEACEINGKLCSLPTSYTIWTMICHDRFSSVKDQTFDDMLAVMENAPEGTEFMAMTNRLDFFYNVLNFSDFAASSNDGVFSVNRDNIQRLMEFCERLPDILEYDENYDYRAAMNNAAYNSFAASSFGDFKQVYDMLDESVTFTGYPTESGNGTVIDPVHTVAVFESCENKEAAWDLIKCMYNSTNIIKGINSGFPVISDTFYKWADSAENSLGEEKCAQAVETVTSAKSLGSGIDHALFRIITEEAERYFAGEYTAEQAADFIKNRTDIFVSERS